jgi:hypothetical protein
VNEQPATSPTPTPTPTPVVPPTTPPTTPPANDVNPGEPPPVSDNKAPGSGKPVASTRLTGVVTPGVEPNCILLNGYLLIGGPRELLRSGAKVTVTGRVQTGMLTTCQQGTPLVVESAMRAE